jgi:hypothetical protein
MVEGKSKTLQEKGHCQVILLEGDVFELSHENAELEVLHFHGNTSNSK